LLDTLNDYVSYIFEDKFQNIWLCGRTDAIKVETVDGEITSVERVPFSNPTIDESVGIAYGNDVYVATGGSFIATISKTMFLKNTIHCPDPKNILRRPDTSGLMTVTDGAQSIRETNCLQAGMARSFPQHSLYRSADKENLWVITANMSCTNFQVVLLNNIKTIIHFFYAKCVLSKAK